MLEHPPVDFLGMLRGRVSSIAPTTKLELPTGIGKEDRESQSKSSSTQIGMEIGYANHDYWDRILGVLHGSNIGLPCGSRPIVPCDNAVGDVFPQRLHDVLEMLKKVVPGRFNLAFANSVLLPSRPARATG